MFLSLQTDASQWHLEQGCITGDIWSRRTTCWSDPKSVKGQLWSLGLLTEHPKPKPRRTPAYSSSSSVVNKFSRNPVSPPAGFWMSKPPSSRARKFSSSLARGLGTMFSCRKQQWAIIAGQLPERWGCKELWYSIHVLQRDINTFPCCSWDRLCRKPVITSLILEMVAWIYRLSTRCFSS